MPNEPFGYIRDVIQKLRDTVIQIRGSGRALLRTSDPQGIGMIICPCRGARYPTERQDKA